MSDSRINVGVAFFRSVIWIFVFVWCLIPILWALFLFATSIGHGSGEAPRPNDLQPFGPGRDQTLIMQVAGSVFLMTLFAYGVWCAVGVMMGFGLDRTVEVASATFALIRGQDTDDDGDGASHGSRVV